ncbi:branched-chain amino acid ABC transporter permease [Pararhizobium sp. LjRoot255]|jgi:branched-chain amino acid transport system permease protein|uniref:branched-chain amino acid ABC transporter permease n=1 Tax=Pararhizobium sp. LjRoot255 TaxID=3342298 RepID=UPI003ECCA6B4
MKTAAIYTSVAGGAGLLAAFPLWLGDYGQGLAVGFMGYVALACSWALFSGPTRYVSLATVAFFGIGAYSVAFLNEYVSYWLILPCAGLVGLAVSLVVGLATLRLAGIYFVIFSFGLAEMVRQLLTWYEVNITGALGRYIFAPVDTRHIYWMLLGISIVAIGLRWWIDRGRLGLAVRAIGDDETVAGHAGVDVTWVKLALFSLSSVLITLVGAVQAPRWVYVEPSIAFNPTISFMTVIMALLGGASRLWGPLFGVIPLFLLFEWLSGHFPDHYSMILGLVFIAIVFVFPDGVLARIEDGWQKLRCRRSESEVVHERLA